MLRVNNQPVREWSCKLYQLLNTEEVETVEEETQLKYEIVTIAFDIFKTFKAFFTD